MSESQRIEEQIPAMRCLASMTQILPARAGRCLPLACHSAGIRTHSVADRASVRQQRLGEGSTLSKVLLPTRDAMGILAAKETSSQAGLLVVADLCEGDGAR